MAAAIAEGLCRRGVNDRLADLAAHSGWAAFHHGAQTWVEEPRPRTGSTNPGPELDAQLARAFADPSVLSAPGGSAPGRPG